MIEQTEFIYSSLGKAFEKKNVNNWGSERKKIKAIEKHWKQGLKINAIIKKYWKR